MVKVVKVILVIFIFGNRSFAHYNINKIYIIVAVLTIPFRF